MRNRNSVLFGDFEGSASSLEEKNCQRTSMVTTVKLNTHIRLRKAAIEGPCRRRE